MKNNIFVTIVLFIFIQSCLRYLRTGDFYTQAVILEPLVFTDVIQVFC